jgi:PAS domain S-box-containing protein
MNNIPDAILFKDVESRYIKVSKALLAAMAFKSEEEIIGKTDHDLFPAGLANTLRDEDESIISSRKPITDKTFEMPFPSGTKLWLSITKSPMFDSEGNITGIVGIARDISERKAAEERVEKSEMLFRKIWEHSFDGIYLLNGKGRIIMVNNSFCKLVGKPREELQGKNFEILFAKDFVASHDFDELKPFMVSVKSTKKRITLWNGVQIWLEASRAAIKIENQSPLILGIFKDITEYIKIKEAIESEKEELNVTLRSIHDGVISTDSSDKIILVNASVEKMLGWGNSELIGMSIINLFELLKADYNAYAGKNNFSTIFRMYHSNESIVSDTMEIITKEGQKKVILCGSADVSDANGKPRGFVYVLRDITEQVKIEMQLHLSQKLESIGQLAAGIAHEINTPMQYISDNAVFIKDAFSSIKQYLDYIEETLSASTMAEPEVRKIIDKKESMDIEYLRDEIFEEISQSQSGIERVSRIVLAMKNFAHPDLKEKAYSNLNKAIEVTALISKSEWKYVADLELELDSTLALVYCNIDELNQVILNMIINAAHAIKETTNGNNKGKITISTRSQENFADIIIADTGIGISPENLERIFDPFFTTKDVGKGTGQGLAIAHNIVVNRHKGAIYVDSVLGEGTTFTIQIPIEKKEDNKDEEE